MIRNKENDTIVKDYIVYLHKLKYSKKTCKVYVLDKLRIFTNEKTFKEISIDDLKNFFTYLKTVNMFSDMYLSSLGTELRRFFKYLKIRGINDNLMYNLVIPAHRKHDPHIPLKILIARYRKFHPRAVKLVPGK